MMLQASVIEVDERLLFDVFAGGKWTNAATFCASTVGAAAETIAGISMVNPVYGAVVGVGACVYGGAWAYVLTPPGG